MKINQKSNNLTVLIGSYNRLNLLKRTIASVKEQTRCSYEIIVIDAGSTDGTIEYLNSQHDITPVFQGKLLGAARAYNDVWRNVESKYTCWLSDDTELANGGLDLAVQILEKDSDIGMVSLKTKDVAGYWTSLPYIGALSIYGILNCNHGVLSMELLRSVGYFNQDYRTYLIDPDLTASVLSAGKKVVMTKDVCVLHHREWADENWQDKIRSTTQGVDHPEVYREKFKYLKRRTPADRLKKWMGRLISLPLLDRLFMKIWKLNSRDWLNLTQGRFIKIMDVVTNIYNPYHNVQCIPYDILSRDENPYKQLVQENP